MVDFDGNWIIEPFYGHFKAVLSNLIIVRDNDKGLLLYDKNGQLATNKKYDIIQKNINSRISSRRIFVGVIDDKEYVKKAKKLNRSYLGETQNLRTEEEIEQMLQKAKNLSGDKHRDYLKAIEKQGKPKVLYGYINLSLIHI